MKLIISIAIILAVVLPVIFTSRDGTVASTTSTTTTSPAPPPPCNASYNLVYQESPRLSYDGAPLRFVYDTNFRAYVYIYQPSTDNSIKIVKENWGFEYTLNIGFNPKVSYLLLDSSNNIYVVYSNFALFNTTIVKIDPYGTFQWRSSVNFRYAYEPSIYIDNMYFLGQNGTHIPVAKINLNNGNVTILPVFCPNSFSSSTCRLNVFSNRFYSLNSNFQYTPIDMYDLNGTFINQSNYTFQAFGSYVSPEGFIYYLGYGPFNSFASLFKIDRNLTLIWSIPIDIYPWGMNFLGTKLFVNQNILYYIGTTRYTNGTTYLSSYSDINGSFISTTNHTFSNNLFDVTMNFDSLSRTAYFLGLKPPNGIDPIGAAINTFCIP